MVLEICNNLKFYIYLNILIFFGEVSFSTLLATYVYIYAVCYDAWILYFSGVSRTDTGYRYDTLWIRTDTRIQKFEGWIRLRYVNIHIGYVSLVIILDTRG